MAAQVKGKAGARRDGQLPWPISGKAPSDESYRLTLPSPSSFSEEPALPRAAGGGPDWRAGGALGVEARRAGRWQSAGRARGAGARRGGGKQPVSARATVGAECKAGRAARPPLQRACLLLLCLMRCCAI